ncbi:MAG: hypothetical protein ACTHU0_32300 [Kofleriaceae bacterium]
MVVVLTKGYAVSATTHWLTLELVTLAYRNKKLPLLDFDAMQGIPSEQGRDAGLCVR